MKVLGMHDITPVILMPGDDLTVNWRRTVFLDGVFSDVDEVQLIQRTFEETRTVDRVAIVELEDGELACLGMKQGIGAVLGEAL